ncbi:MAG: uridine phosphorylase [Nitrososphaeria archaeon]|nr:uridine phosphorylase [Aigarchaeota archaeon]MCX8187691.1 uridine phosphorylase [Nitrososphaeria archaeon]MDW8021852.1 uridine phosphorylase [Nitrososphaerota archaeon]
MAVSAGEPRSDGRFYHIQVKPGEISEYVLLPGDPGRVPLIAEFWDEGWEVSSHREFVVWSGRIKGRMISACSTGIGSSSASIAIEELARAGAHTFIRVGSTGSISPEVDVGELVISAAAVRLEGASLDYAPPEYPAFANYEVLLALIEAAEILNVRYHVGVTATTDSFYIGQGRMGYRGYSSKYSREVISELRAMGVINFDMETSAILTISSIYGLRAGSVCAVFANRIKDTFKVSGEREAAAVAVEAVKILQEWDELKRGHGKPRIYPSLLNLWKR